MISILTPTIPGRERFLAECHASVQAQTTDQFEHIVTLDANGDGCAVTMNLCAEKATGEWLLPLADDDLLLPRALENLLAAEGDVIYSPPLVTGNEDRFWFWQSPPVLPSCALIRASLWRELGGYDETLSHEEDRAMWVKALDVGAVFTRVDEPCWVYRQHEANKSFHKAAA